MEEKKVGVCVTCGASDVELDEENKCSNCSEDKSSEDHSHDHGEGDDQHSHGDTDEHQH